MPPIILEKMTIYKHPMTSNKRHPEHEHRHGHTAGHSYGVLLPSTLDNGLLERPVVIGCNVLEKVFM